MRLFISYAHRNQTTVEDVINVLKQAHDVWYDREIQGGQAWWTVILEEIRNCDCFF